MNREARIIFSGLVGAGLGIVLCPLAGIFLPFPLGYEMGDLLIYMMVGGVVGAILIAIVYDLITIVAERRAKEREND